MWIMDINWHWQELLDSLIANPWNRVVLVMRNQVTVVNRSTLRIESSLTEVDRSK